MGIAEAIDLVMTLVSRAGTVSSLIKKARAEGRDTLSDDEVNQLVAENDAARAELQAAIDKAGD